MKEIKAFCSAKKKVDTELARSSLLYVAAVQAIANKYGVHIATGHLSDIWQIGEKWGDFKMDDDKCSRNERFAFNALSKLDEVASEIRIGPSNMERFSPLLAVI